MTVNPALPLRNMDPDEAGINELIAEILMVLLIVGIVIIILIMVMGVSLSAQKTAYLVTSADAIDSANNSIVMLSHNQGDAVSLYPVATYGYPVQVTMTNGSVTYTAVPLPQTQAKSWSSGDKLYLVRNASGVMLASSPLLVQGNYGFFPGA